MCGRIAQVHTPDELSELLGIAGGLDDLAGMSRSYNVPPSAVLPAITVGKHGLHWESFAWGFLPAWIKRGRPMINARSETVAEKRMFRSAFRWRRCVLPATAWYEWLTMTGQQKKQPYCIRPQDDTELLFLAGIYENGTCAILTRAARPDLRFIHERMPVVMPRALLEFYLDTPVPEMVFGTADELSLKAYPVTTRVGSPKFNAPECLVPIAV